jgi:hypothetical protein
MNSFEKIKFGLAPDDFSLNLDPYIRENRQASDVSPSRSLEADKLGIIITDVSNAVGQASTIQELDLETYHIFIEEAQALRPDRIEDNSCIIAKGPWGMLMHFSRYYSGCLWSKCSSFCTCSEESDILHVC